jgi:signal-transduction protein with cAMP-binding, CBS, and nucleotidyltransferase domain
MGVDGHRQQVELAAVQDELVRQLARQRPFDRLQRPHLVWLATRLRPCAHASGAVVLAPGEKPDRLHVIQHGQVELEAAGSLGSGGRNLGTLTEGDCFPLEELHDARAGFAVFRAVDEVRCLELPTSDFRELQGMSPEFRAWCEKRSAHLMESWRRVHQVQLAQIDSVVSQVAASVGGARELGAAVRRARDARAVAGLASEIRLMGSSLLAQGLAPSQLTRLLSALYDRVAEQIVRLEMAARDLAGVDFCWLAFGSEARMEQTLFTDQDNGIVFDPGGGDPEALRTRLVEAGRAINQELAACGFPMCQGMVMAGNPAWCLTPDEWRTRFSAWLDRPEPAALLNASIFFDLRPVWGNRALAQGLLEWLARVVPERRRFLLLLTGNALAHQPPLGFFRDFVVAGEGDHPGTIDAKLDGTGVYVEAARIYGLASGCTAAGTEARLRHACEKLGLAHLDVEAWVDGFLFLQGLRLRHQYQLVQAGKPLHNHVDPEALNPLDRTFLREALKQAGQLQKRVRRAFGPESAGV